MKLFLFNKFIGFNCEEKSECTFYIFLTFGWKTYKLETLSKIISANTKKNEDGKVAYEEMNYYFTK